MQKRYSLLSSDKIYEKHYSRLKGELGQEQSLNSVKQPEQAPQEGKLEETLREVIEVAKQFGRERTVQAKGVR